MTKLLTSTWMTATLSALIYLGATVAFWKTPTPPVRPPEQNGATGANTQGPSWDFVNPEADQLIEELKADKKALQSKERHRVLHPQATRLNIKQNSQTRELFFAH